MHLKKWSAVLLDIILLATIFFIVFYFRFSGAIPTRYTSHFYYLIPMFVLTHLATLIFYDSYRKPTFHAIFSAATFASFALGSIGFFDRTFLLPRTVIGFTWAINIIILFTAHFYLLRTKDRTQNILIIGSNGEAHRILDTLKHNHNANILGFLADTDEKAIDRYPVLGTPEHIREFTEKYQINTLIFTQKTQMMNALAKLIDLRVTVKTIPEFTDFIFSKQVDEFGLIEINIYPLTTIDRIIKRGTDIILATIALIITSPIMLITAIIVRLDSPGPVIFRQLRESRLSRPFILYKFRTMVQDAEKHTGPIISDNKTDKRITHTGRFLRNSHIDELPQLFNIIKGDMSIVGPRPERPELSGEFVSRLIEWEKRLYIKPGLTGLAQVYDLTSLDPAQKLKYDLLYIQNYSIFLDLKIMFQTIAKIARQLR